jgi:septum formation protein
MKESIMYRIILASESPRRKEILKQMNIPYEVMSSNAQEEVEYTTPSETVEALATLKAKDVSSRISREGESSIIIGADTMVFHKGEALGKPKDKEDAVQMLKSLSGDVHEVYTGVCIIIRRNNSDSCKDSDETITFSVCTRVEVQQLTIEQIEDYVDTGEPLDKAGSYAIQGEFGIYIKEIHGDYYNIVGFPISKIHERLLAHGINIKKLK